MVERIEIVNASVAKGEMDRVKHHVEDRTKIMPLDGCPGDIFLKVQLSENTIAKAKLTLFYPRYEQKWFLFRTLIGPAHDEIYSEPIIILDTSKTIRCVEDWVISVRSMSIEIKVNSASKDCA